MSNKYVNDTGLNTVSNIVLEKLATKVEAESGKGLSEANFTQEEKTKLSSINPSDYITTSQKEATNGVASLDSNGKIPDGQLENCIIKGYYNTTNGNFYKESSYITEIAGETDKIYIDLGSAKNYRYNGTIFINDASTLVLGTIENTAYPGNLGNANTAAINNLSNSIGTLSNLNTIEKNNIVGAVNEIKDILTFDDTPTEGSDNICSSGTIYSAIINIFQNFSHNCFFRGKNLGAVSSSNINDFITSYGIATGEFNDLFVGDYFTASYNGTDTIFRVAGINLYLNARDAANSQNITSNHIVIVPDNPIENAAMNSTATTANGYAGSNMFKNIIGGSTITTGINLKLYNIFGNHLFKYGEFLSSAVSTSVASRATHSASGAVSNWAFTGIYANLMTSVNLSGEGTTISAFMEYGYPMQFPLFRMEPRYARASSSFWLRDVFSSTQFGVSYGNGIHSYNNANNTCGVRPFFLLG